MTTIKQRLRQVLSQRRSHTLADASRVPSAVLLPIYRKQDEYHLLFTKRTEQVKEHKGEISFPGGACQEEDRTLVDTALRECFEEIGLMADDVEILGKLDDTVTRTSNYLVSPFVAFIPFPYHFKMNPEETEEIIEIPIPALLDKECRQQEIEIIRGQESTQYHYYYQGRVIHGATARILNQFLEIFASVSG